MLKLLESQSRFSKYNVGDIYEHKDGGKYKVIGTYSTILCNTAVKLVAYKLEDVDRIYVRTEEHFKESFKKYVPEYECQYVVLYNNMFSALFMDYATDDEMKKVQANNPRYKYVKLEDTKRIRK